MGRYATALDFAVLDKETSLMRRYEREVARGKEPEIWTNDRTDLVWLMRDEDQGRRAARLRCALKVHAGDKC